MEKLQRVYYFASNFPGPKARHVQMANMIDSFVNNSLKVDFILRKFNKSFTDDIASFYDLNNYFKYEELNSINFLPVKYDFYFKINLRKILSDIGKSKSNETSVIYTRYGKNSGSILENIIKYKLKYPDSTPGIVAEVHQGLSDRETEFVKLLDGVVVISPGLRDELVDSGVSSHKILIAHSGVDLDCYDDNHDKNRMLIREKLQIPFTKNLVMYTGHLYEDRGVETLVKSAKYLDEEYLILIVGGLKKDINRINKVIEEEGLERKVLLLGNKPSNKIHLYQLASDMLVMPYSGKWSLQNWSSPMKLFEYMASKRPIISSDFETIRSVLDDESCLFIQPDNAEQLGGAIEKCITDKEFSEKLSTKSYQKVKEYTWDERAKKIINFITNL